MIRSQSAYYENTRRNSMKVLITGGYGFIGSHVADRFHKEDHEIFIIDDLSSGKKENITFKHKGYVLSVDDPKCEEIFKAVRFDIVIHLAAQISVVKSFNNPLLDTESNVVGLVNILSLSQKYHVKKFIFASSAAVYGVNGHLPLSEEEECAPISPYGISKWIGETYCEKWNKIYGFETVCFRFSNVYGPRQNSKGEGGVVSKFVNNTLNSEALKIFGDGEQTRDFIYVGDIADAIYRSTNAPISGVFNLSTNTETSINDLAQIFQDIHGKVKVNRLPGKEGDIRHSVLNNRKLMNGIDWSPLYDIRTGLEKTYQWAARDRAQKEIAATTVEATDKPKNFAHVIKPFKAYIENIVVFLIIAWFVLTNDISIFNTTEIGVFYIMIFGAMYGIKQSILSVGLSIGLLTIEKLFEGREFISLLYDTSFFFQVALFLFIGLVVGYSVQRKTNRLQEQRQKMTELEQRYEFLEGIHTETREVKDELQMRLLNSEDSFGEIYSIIKELDELEPEKVFSKAVQVVKQVMDADNVSIYVFNRNQAFLRLVANTNFSQSAQKNSIKATEYKYIQHVLQTGTIFVNKELWPDTPIMAAPIYRNNKISAVITIDWMEFKHMSLYHENLFKITTELAGSALDRALRYIEATEANRFIPETNVLYLEVFKSILESKREQKDKYGMPYAVLEAFVVQQEISVYANKLSNLLRETDYIGMLDQNRMGVILSNTNRNDVELILSRFEANHISMRLLEGEM